MAATLKKIGITGAAGNLGSTLTQGLMDQYALTLFDLKELKAPPGATFVKVDFAEQKELAGKFNTLDALIHLAGNPSPDAPRAQTMRNNFMATSFVFEEAFRAGVKKIVFASSNFYHEEDVSSLLQGKTKNKITLDMPPTPQSLYGESKVFGESIGRHMAYLGKQFVALRIGWTVPQDNPALYGGSYMRAVFCSKRDLVQAFEKALEIETSFLAAFVTSDNSHNVFDLNETKRKLGFNPRDDAESYF